MTSTNQHDYIDEWENKTLNVAIKINMQKGIKAATAYINKEAAKLQKEILDK